jgi:cellulase/cellobiase CelA1
MIWLNRAGGAGPAGPQVATVSLAGATWSVHFAAFTDWNYIAYIRTTPTSSVSNLDIQAFTQDAVSRGYIQPSWYLSGVEVGFELWVNGAGLASNSFSFTTQGGNPDPDPDPDPDPEPGACEVQWQTNDWGSGFVADVTVTNLGAPINGWDLTWTFPGNQQITNNWGTELQQTGPNVVAGNAGWNGSLGTGGSANLGFQATYSGSNAAPSSVALNGVACTLT